MIFFDQFGESLENEDDVCQGVFIDIDYIMVVNYFLLNLNFIMGQKLVLYRIYVIDI